MQVFRLVPGARCVECSNSRTTEPKLSRPPYPWLSVFARAARDPQTRLFLQKPTKNILVVENALRMIQTRLFPYCEYPWSWQVVCSFYFHEIHLLCHLSGQDLAVHVQSYCWIEVGIPKLMLHVENPLQHQQTKIYKPLIICKIPMLVSWESSDVIAPFPKKQNGWLHKWLSFLLRPSENL